MRRIPRAGERADRPVDNASDTETATFIAFYLLPPGEDRLIEFLA